MTLNRLLDALLGSPKSVGTDAGVSEATAKVVYDESVRGITRQQGVVDALRSRAATLFTGASLVTAFLGGQALTRDPDLNVLAWVAIGAFVALFGLVILILWPWKFRFVLSAQILIEDHLHKDPAQLHRYLAEVWEKNYDLNQVRVGQLHLIFRAACAALSIEVVAWLISIGRG